MKLYATTTSERATKGQGGKWLEIALKSNKTPLPFCFIKVQEKDENNIHIGITANGDLRNGVFYVIPKELKTKGKKQKGEN